MGTRSIPHTNPGYTANLTPLEGPDSPNQSSFSSYERRLREHDVALCYAYHRNPQFTGLTCIGPAYQYWDTSTCRLCNIFVSGEHDDSVNSNDDHYTYQDLIPQSGVFSDGGFYQGMPVPELFLYKDSSIILEAMDLVVKKRNAYYAYFIVGDFSLPFPDSDFYSASIPIALQLFDKKPLKPQSGIMEEVASSETQVLTSFVDDMIHEEAAYKQEMDNTHYIVDTEEVSLARFLSRPLKIFSLNVIVGGPPAVAPVFILPSLFFTNKRVINRLNNYRNMKCDLCFRFLINGTPMHYGRWMATAVSNNAADSYLTPATLTSLPAASVLLSQPPHVFLDPTACEGGCLRLPYLHHHNAFNMIAGEHLTTGYIALTELSPLRSMSAVQDGITITVMCWAENIVLGAPTTTNLPGLVPQSGDEYGRGIVSNTLNVLAQASGMLAQIAVIRPYALASQSILTLGAKVAIALGFSKPIVITDINYVAPRITPNLASAVQHDPIFKATLDDKQEVTIDPSVVGLERRDEMTLASIIQRESYVTKFSWTSTAIPDFNVFYTNVSPVFWANGTGTASTQQIAMTPLAYVCQAFRQWRGSLRFRFVAVASSFHKGRMRIVFDPDGITTNATTPIEYNTAYTYVWDLGESHEAIIDVGYMSNQAYLRPLQPGVDTVVNTYAGVPVTFNPAASNGHLCCSVLNELTCANSATTNVDVLMFVSAGPDFELFDPVDNIDLYSMYPQSGTIDMETHLAGINRPHVLFGKYISRTDKSPMVHHGDPVVSLRYLLKRYVTYMGIPLSSILAGGSINYRTNFSAFPLNKGKAPAAMHLAGVFPYNYVFQTPLAWFSAMFIARRGGIRWRLKDQSTAGVQVTSLKVVRNSSSTAYFYSPSPNVAFTSPSDGSKKFLTTAPNSGAAGMTLASYIDGGRVNADMEIPYHSPRRFSAGRVGDNSLTHNQGVSIFISATNTSTSTRDGLLSVSVAAADDFSLHGFVSCPMVYYTPTLL